MNLIHLHRAYNKAQASYNSLLWSVSIERVPFVKELLYPFIVDGVIPHN